MPSTYFLLGSVSRSKKTAFFFFQAEDGIRDVAVTGVQTCALPICRRVRRIEGGVAAVAGREIGIGEKRHAEGDKIGFATRNHRLAGAGVVAAVRDQRASERIAQD